MLKRHANEREKVHVIYNLMHVLYSQIRLFLLCVVRFLCVRIELGVREMDKNQQKWSKGSAALKPLPVTSKSQNIKQCINFFVTKLTAT